MKSSDEQLKNRGFIAKEDINEYIDLNESELLELLKSKEAYKRTIAIKLLSNKSQVDEHITNLFCNMLL